MINKKSILVFTFLLSFATQQIDAGPRWSKLNSTTNVSSAKTNGSQPQQTEATVTQENNAQTVPTENINFLSVATNTNPTQSQKALVGYRSESRPVPEYFEFKPEQTRTFETLPDELKYVIGQFVGFNQSVNKACSFDPFQYPIYHQDGNAVQVLVALRADLHDKKCRYEHEKVTPLHSAIEQYGFACNSTKTQEQRDSLAIVEFLLRKKIGINKPGKYQETPMHQAAYKGLIDITQRLIIAQADLSLKNRWNETPLDKARNQAMSPTNPKYRKKSYEICAILEQAGATSSVVLKSMPTDATMEEEYNLPFQAKYSAIEARLGGWENDFSF